MHLRSHMMAILACGALGTLGCGMEPTSDGTGQGTGEENTEQVTSAETVSGWTPWSSGSCGPSGCTTIVQPTCANGSYASAWESDSFRSRFRLLCNTGPSGTTNHVWAQDCPPDKVATGISCLTSAGQQFCSPAIVRCSTPVGWNTGGSTVAATQVASFRYSCPPSGATGRGYVDRVNYAGGVCGAVFAPLF